MHKRTIETAGISVGAIGLGCMGMSFAYGSSGLDDDKSIAVIHRALEQGATLIDTSDVYGPFTNEELVGRALAGKRDRATLATKVGLEIVRDGASFALRTNGRPEHIRAACEASLRRLRTDVIDLYYLHRVDPAVPIEDSVGAMAELVRAGKVRALGLSEVRVPELERAARVHPIAAVQSELSLWTRDFLGDVVPWCAHHSVAFVAYSPLGRGYLTGRFRTRDDFDRDDWRLTNPRFSAAALAENASILAVVEEIAHATGATAAQVALAWTLAAGPHVIPIPGTRSPARLDENLAATALRLSADDLARLATAPRPVGERYTPPASSR